MTAPVDASEIGRIVALRALALALRTPTSALLDEVRLLAGVVAEHGGALGPTARALQAAAEGEVEAIAAAQLRLFGGDVAVPPYEGSYETDPFRQARQLADVAGFYRAFGAETHGPAGERPDHAGAELEFLAFAAVRRIEAEADGRPDDAVACHEAERLFLQEHAGRWLPVFFEALVAAAPDAFHSALGRLGEAAIEAALESLDVTTDRVAARARRTPVEADELTCAAGDETVLQGLV